MTATTPPPIVLQAPGPTSALSLEFFWQRDRWAQRWLILNDMDSIELMSSVEGSSEESFPPSPPTQDLHHQTLPQGDAALGVGMAGKGHWSCSYSLLTGASSSPGIMADLACLQKQRNDASSGWLGSRYQLGSSIEVVEHNHDRVRLKVTERDFYWEVVGLAPPDWPSDWVGGCLSISDVDGILEVAPKSRSSDNAMASRWQFTVRLVDLACK